MFRNSIDQASRNDRMRKAQFVLSQGRGEEGVRFWKKSNKIGWLTYLLCIGSIVSGSLVATIFMHPLLGIAPLAIWSAYLMRKTGQRPEGFSIPPQQRMMSA
ncbi:MAG: hypothetical protein HQL36_03675 [Alphaproteobacteria bacterium]|nr:hypothetical protein [Alphaproteobacteria bacterium]